MCKYMYVCGVYLCVVFVGGDGGCDGVCVCAKASLRK